MPLRSVYEIDVDPSNKVRDFFDAFSQHREEVGGAGEEWAKAFQRAGTAAKGVSDYLAQFESEFKDLAATGTKAAKDQAAAMNDVADAARKAATWQAQFGAAISTGSHHLGTAAKSAKSIAGDLAEGTRWLMKWTGISTAIGGLIGAGSLFGLDRLAAGVGDRRFNSQGLGIRNSTDQQAFALAYSRVVNPDAFLGNVAAARSDYNKQKAFGALNIGQDQVDNLDTVALAKLTAERLQTFWAAQPDHSAQTLHAYGLDALGSLDDMRRFLAADPGLRKEGDQYDQLRRKLYVPDNEQAAWQDFNIQLHAAGDKVTNAFLDSFASAHLTEDLSDLSEAASEAIRTFLTAPDLKTWLHELGDGLKSTATFLTSKDFQDDMKTFVTDVGEMATAVKSFLDVFGFTSTVGAIAGARVGGAVGGVPGAIMGGLIGSDAGPYMGQVDFNSGLKQANENWLKDHPGGNFGDFYGWYVGYYADTHPGWKPPTQTQHGWYPTTPAQRAYWPNFDSNAQTAVARFQSQFGGPDANRLAGLTTDDLAIMNRESRGNPNLGWAGLPGSADYSPGGTDLSNTPLDSTGFPAWPGKMGPAGNSTAAGLFMITRSNWHKYAPALGIKDFSPESQLKVRRAMQAAEIAAGLPANIDWAASGAVLPVGPLANLSAGHRWPEWLDTPQALNAWWSGAPDIYRSTSNTGRSPFPPWVKVNSKGEPYELNMSPQEKANSDAAYAYIKGHPTNWTGAPSGFYGLTWDSNGTPHNAGAPAESDFNRDAWIGFAREIIKRHAPPAENPAAVSPRSSLDNGRSRFAANIGSQTMRVQVDVNNLTGGSSIISASQSAVPS